MSISLPPGVLRRALTLAGVQAPSDAALVRVVESLEESGYLIVSRADMHTLRAAADRVVRFVPEPGHGHERYGGRGR